MEFNIILKKLSHLNLIRFFDVDGGSNPDDRKSTIGFYIFLRCNMVFHCSKKQHIVSFDHRSKM